MARRKLTLKVAEIEPSVAYAGEREQFTVRLGGIAVPPGGRVKLRLCGGRGNACDWQEPQLFDPAGEAYVSVGTTGPAEVQGTAVGWREAQESGVVVSVGEPGLAEEDLLVIVLGDTSEGGPGIRPQTFSQRQKPFLVFVDLGDGEWQAVENPPSLEVRGGPPDHLVLIVPSLLRPSERFHGLIKVEDQFGNGASYYAGHLQLRGDGASLKIDSPLVVEPQDSSRRVVTAQAPEEPATFWVRVREPRQGLEARSNPACAVPEEEYPYRLYWGVLHGHTANSDGIGTPEEYFAHAREVSGLDFAALGDHDHAWETTDDMWGCAQEVTAEANEPGSFVTFLGYEWAKWRRNGDGDRCVYYLDDYQPMYRSDDGHYPRPWHLFDKLNQAHRRRALVIPHHTASKGNWCDFSQHDPLHERLIEIYSVWGSSECSVHEGNPFPMRPPGLPEGGEAYDLPLDAGEEPLGFVQRALALGWRVGFTGGGDDHLGHPGDAVRCGPEPFHYRDGLLGVWAAELTREALWEAMWQRRTLASTGARIIVGWALSGEFMGSELIVEPGEALMFNRVIVVEAMAERPIASVEIVRNNEVVHVEHPRSLQATIEWTDEDPLDLIALQPNPSQAPFVFYYVRVTQAGGERVWASPIWLTLAE